MFKNFKVIAHMASPVCVTDFIILDGVISAAIAKKLNGDNYYCGANICGTKETIDEWLNKVLDKQYGVYCTSIGLGDSKEYISSWCKRWDDKNDDMVKFKGKGKQRIDIGSGNFKSYHMPLVIKSYKNITFYVRGDMENVKELLENYIYYLGKKSSQGYGQIRKWEFKEVEQDWSIWKDNKPMRPIPGLQCQEYIKVGKDLNLQECAIIPPYWRQDYRELCVMPSTD
jgi:CRISPR type IV-associated protein Csf3